MGRLLPLKILSPSMLILTLVLLLNVHGTAYGRRRRETVPYDTDKDWISGIAAKGEGGCQFAKKAKYRLPPSCPQPTVDISRKDASGMGYRFAPIVYQHPLDGSWLTDPRHWFKEATAYDTGSWMPLQNISISPAAGPMSYDFLTSQKSFASRLATPSYNESNGQVDWQVVNGSTLERKAQIDPVVDGRLTGKVWYTVFRPHNMTTGEVFPHAYVYTYFLFYPWNGCSNQLLATNVDGKKQAIEYYMCGDGIHEGDLEHVKVYVCEADMLNEDPSVAVQRMQMSQHGWLPELDCKAGECTFEVDDNGVRRVVTYAGLFSHSNWANESALYVYQKARSKMLLNVDGLYVGDRYMKGPVWYPNETNTLFLPFLSEMTEEQQGDEFAWATFPGVWGSTLKQVGRGTITCIVNGTRDEAPCPDENPAYYILKWFKGPKSWRKEDMVYTGQKGGNTVTGPLWKRVFALNWEMEREAPVFNGLTLHTVLKFDYDGYCPFENPDVEDTRTDFTTHGGSELEDFAFNLLAVILMSTIVTLTMVMPVLLARRDKDILEQLQEELNPEEHPKCRSSSGTSASASQSRSGSRTGTAPQVLLAELQEMSPSSREPTGTATGSGAALTRPPEPLMMGIQSSEASALKSGNDEHKGAKEGCNDTVAKAKPSPLEYFPVVIMRVFHANVLQPYLLTLWIFIGVAAYIIGLVLSSLGMEDIITALNRIKEMGTWQVIKDLAIVTFAVFGVVHLVIVIVSLFARPMSSKVCDCRTRRLQCIRTSWRAHGILAGLLVIEMNITMLLFATGILLWGARYGLEQTCNFMVARLFQQVSFATDVCVDLNWVGISAELCGADIVNMCSIWVDLHVEYMSYGAVFFLLAQNMFLVLATSNYITLRTGYAIKAASNHQAGPTGGTSSRWVSLKGLLRMRKQRKKTLHPAGRSTDADTHQGDDFTSDPALAQV